MLLNRQIYVGVGLLCSLLVFNTCSAIGYPGLPTRSQNPLLQAYFIPAMPITSQQRWTFSNTLYITNTYQLDRTSSENLVIDVENTRYDFQATWRHQLWHFNIGLSLINNDAGFLDQTIENWHDFFGLPQGSRDTALNDQVNLLYETTAGRVVDIQRGGSGLADIQLAAGYQVNQHGQLWVAAELPSGENDPLLSNDGIDLAAWYAGSFDHGSSLQAYGLLGVAIPADDGLFRGRLRDFYGFAQLGLVYSFRPAWVFFVQSDLHSAIVDGSEVDALDDSLQVQFGLRLPRLIERHRLELFFSEDIFPGHAPDITFGLRLSPAID